MGMIYHHMILLGLRCRIFLGALTLPIISSWIYHLNPTYPLGPLPWSCPVPFSSSPIVLMPVFLQCSDCGWVLSYLGLQILVCQGQLHFTLLSWCYINGISFLWRVSVWMTGYVDDLRTYQCQCVPEGSISWPCLVLLCLILSMLDIHCTLHSCLLN